MKPKALGGPVFEDGEDARPPVATGWPQWLTRPENPFFAKSLVNRVWYHLVGRGIVEPVDDFRDSNPASNDELLDGLDRRLRRRAATTCGTSIRTILTSRTYQLSARPNELNADDTMYFSHAYTKLLPAEVLLDAISTVTATASDVRRPARGLPRHADPRRQDGEPVPQDLRPPGPRAGLRVRARERLEPLARPSSSSAARRSTASSATTTAGWPSSPRATSRPRRSPASFTWSPSPASPTPPS